MLENYEISPNTENIHHLFLTGGSGYVGRNLIRHYRAAGIEVTALVRSQKSFEAVSALGARAVMGDLQGKNLAELMAGCDALIHAAADVNHGYTTDSQIEVNATGTTSIFSAAKKAGIKRALYISTESVLLDGNPLINATESHPYPAKPAGNYSLSKKLAEQAALSFTSATFSVVIVRPRFVWGRDDTTSMPQLIAAATSGKFAWIDGGTYLTSTTHIANLCEGVSLGLIRGRNGQIYFIADAKPVEFKTFVSQLLATQGIQVSDKKVLRKLIHNIARIGDFLARISKGRIQLPVTVQSYATSAVEVTIDIGKAQRELGYSPPISHERGLAELM